MHLSMIQRSTIMKLAHNHNLTLSENLLHWRSVLVFWAPSLYVVLRRSVRRNRQSWHFPRTSFTGDWCWFFFFFFFGVYQNTITQTTLLRTLHVEYEERRNKHGILFIFSLFCEYIKLEYVRVHIIYTVHQAEYGIRVLVAMPQEYAVRSAIINRAPHAPSPSGAAWVATTPRYCIAHSAPCPRPFILFPWIRIQHVL